MVESGLSPVHPFPKKATFLWMMRARALRGTDVTPLAHGTYLTS